MIVKVTIPGEAVKSLYATNVEYKDSAIVLTTPGGKREILLPPGAAVRVHNGTHGSHA